MNQTNWSAVSTVMSAVAIVFAAGVAWSRGQLSGQVAGIERLINEWRKDAADWRVDIKGDMNQMRDELKAEIHQIREQIAHE